MNRKEIARVISALLSHSPPWVWASLILEAISRSLRRRGAAEMPREKISTPRPSESWIGSSEDLEKKIRHALYMARELEEAAAAWRGAARGWQMLRRKEKNEGDQSGVG